MKFSIFKQIPELGVRKSACVSARTPDSHPIPQTAIIAVAQILGIVAFRNKDV